MLHRLHWIITLPAHVAEVVAVIVATVLLPSTGVFAAGTAVVIPAYKQPASVQLLEPTPPPVQPVVQTPAPVISKVVADTPVIAQGDYLGGLACAPTSVSMVLSYFHAINSSYQPATPQQLATEQDVYDHEGVPYQTLAPRVVALGYGYFVGQRQTTLSELKAELLNGPVIAIVGMDGVHGRLIPGSVAHSLVVVAIAGDGSTITLNDPWTGEQLTLSQSEFMQLWAGGENSTVVIRPS